MKKYKTNTKLFELQKSETDFPNVEITGSPAALEFIKGFYSDDIEVFESFYILLLNRANNTIGYAKISQGGAGTVVDIKILLNYVVGSLASSVILAHNHPSGNTAPSEADKIITKKIKEACALVDCQVLDHLILTKDSYFSFGDEGII